MLGTERNGWTSLTCAVMFIVKINFSAFFFPLLFSLSVHNHMRNLMLKAWLRNSPVDSLQFYHLQINTFSFFFFQCAITFRAWFKISQWNINSLSLVFHAPKSISNTANILVGARFGCCLFFESNKCHFVIERWTEMLGAGKTHAHHRLAHTIWILMIKDD